MKLQPLRGAALIVLGLLGLSAGLDVSAYEYHADEKGKVASGSAQFQPWDNQGQLPEGDSRLAELRGINAQIADRSARLEATAFNLKMMEAQIRDKARLASLHTDYQSQLESYQRWLESAERRRQAILGQADPQGMLVSPSFKAINANYASAR
ncbi:MULTISPECIES: hypothetical protein [Hydrocarboniphaga]|uniref:hypothetical protein n=1 Tax=Hydrocarboniphaga TaxID=243627 RepID=UPI002ABC1617|nr:hypothetical protein [Hydrocarboniphaga sp.]MDZ4079293.1 hypothetical protein [Hydrocarboniphaga sp.]